MSFPHFTDNREDRTLAAALKRHLAALREQGSGAIPAVDVASAFFSVSGWNLVAEELERAPRMRLLLGAEPHPEAVRPHPQPGDPPEPAFTKKLIDQGLVELDAALKQSRDLLPFDAATDAAVRQLLEALHGGRVEVRRLTRRFLHAKAWIFRTAGGGVVVGSSNLTAGGLRHNLELNLGMREGPAVPEVENWFDELWSEAEPYDLAALYDRLMAEFPPYLIYLRVLLALYGAELDEEETDSGRGLPLTSFQKHGVWRALRILQKCGGVLIADGVGLGKTFIAGELIQVFRARRQKVLLVCPAALRDGTWNGFLTRFGFDRHVECISYEQLANDAQLGGEQTYLQAQIDEFQLVVIDEAHNYRNPDSDGRAKVLRRLLQGPRRDLVLLSATPVNNSLWDLYHILRYFVKQDAFFADRGVLSLRDRFHEAMRANPYDLSPDQLYPIIDATTVKRTRQFIKRYYQNDLIKLPDGRQVPIQFPQPVATSITYRLEPTLPGFFAELEAALMPADDETPPDLTLARYQPELFRKGANLEEEGKKTAAIVGLLRSGLLKRFESSVCAFSHTALSMAKQHQLFLEALADGWVVKKDVLMDLAEAEDDDQFDEVLNDPDVEREPASAFNKEALRKAVEEDMRLLRKLGQKAGAVKADKDPKLAALVKELERIATEAAESATGKADEQRKRKVLVFSFYEDTVDWIVGFLDRELERNPKLAAFRGRMASVAGKDTRGGVTRDKAVWGFAPMTSGAPAGQQEDRFDLLVCTDVLAEGLNLQQCRNIINYDLPWNPMRLVQRHGRVDRIGSDHPRVFLRTFFPDDDLDAMLELENRVRVKLARAAASIGVETTPIAGGAEGQQTFAETREEIEKLRKADAEIYERGGTVASAQTGEEYRQELRRALLARRSEIEGLPWKAGSGMAKGKQRGHFFCAQVGARVYLRFVPYEGETILKEEGTCLRIIECTEGTERVVPMDLKQTAFPAWERARRNIFDSWSFETDPANLQPKVPALCRKIAEHLRANPPSAMEAGKLDRLLNSVEAPIARRDENQLRKILEATSDTGEAKSLALVAEIERLGLEPYEAPKELPPITETDVHLVCWMAVEKVG